MLVEAPASAATPDAQGGGFADAGLEGAYYANPDLEGAPSFTRRDVRIDFDWGQARLVGGSTARPYRTFPAHGFSVRWSGRVIARFDEGYTFAGEANDGIRIRIRAPGEPTWTVIVDRWDRAGSFESQPVAMRANELYDIEVEYRSGEGPARCVLVWRSTSTPDEVVDPVRQQGINVTRWDWVRYLWADGTKAARYGKGSENVDAEGWPSTSGVELVLSEMSPTDPDMSGTYLLQFQGQAEVRQECCARAIFGANGKASERTLPRGVGYDAATNTTTASMAVEGSRTMLIFDDSKRTSTATNDGVRDIRFMRPVGQGSAEHHQLDEITYRPFKRVLENHFTVLRLLGMAESEVGDWSTRTLPSYPFFVGENGKENWEHLTMLANETGRDLYITVPIAADDEYVNKLALLLRYGSDGHEPYRRPTSNPRYPPLNPNLRVYVEIDNEIWNWAFHTTQVARKLTQAAHDGGSSTWKAIDYDGKVGDPGGIRAMRRWHAVRTVQASQTFRRVWGDQAMGPRVRMVLEYQYDDYQETASTSLDFIDDYYNNRSKAYVAEPHPVTYFLWGAGGAAYYGLANSTGQQTDTLFGDASFETTSIETGTVRSRPQAGAWRFRGDAGLIRPKEGKDIDGFANAPAPISGEQAAFLRGKGSISQEIRFAKSGTYAVAFRAAGSGEGWPGFQEFDVLIDGRRANPANQRDPRVSTETVMFGGWGRGINTLGHEWGSAPFRIDEPGPHVVTFVGRDDSPNYLLLDDIRIASADAILSSGFDKGEAQGQEGEPDFAYQLQTQAKYARSFGLQVLAYEAGWSLGGDLDQRPIQNWCKFEDSRAKAINDEAIRLWDLSGSFLPVWGVYQYWPTYDFAGAEDYPIMRSFREATQRLREEPASGRRLPATLRVDDADWTHRSDSDASWCERHIPWLEARKDRWHAWMLVAPQTSNYTLHITGRGTGRGSVEVDGETIGELTSLDQAGVRLQSKLTKGPHAVRIIVVGAGLELDRIEVLPDPAGR